jgi:hypothetical protein
MCGTVAWLQGKTCGDDEQFDLATWFPSLIYHYVKLKISDYGKPKTAKS